MFVAVFIDMVGIGIAFPVLPILVGDYTTSNAAQTHWAIALSVTYSLMQFLCAPLLGAISDRFGRRVVLIAAIVGLGIHYILIATAPSLWIMLLARILGGITGASFSVANAYLADISPPEERAKSFGLIGAAFGLGFICGPPLGGLLGAIDLHLPFYAAAGVVASQRPLRLLLRARNRFRPSGAENFPSPRPIRSAPSSRSSKTTRSAASSIVFALFALAHMAMIQNWALFTHFRFGWGTFENGMLLFFVGVLSTVVQGGLLGPSRQALRRRAAGADRHRQQRARADRLRARAAGWMMFPILFSSFLIFTAGPSIQGVVSKSMGPTEQGVTLGAMQSINSLAAVIGPLIAGQILAEVSSLPPTDCQGRRAFLLLRGAESRGVPARVAPLGEAAPAS